jgi:hypothetical protein
MPYSEAKNLPKNQLNYWKEVQREKTLSRRAISTEDKWGQEKVKRLLREDRLKDLKEMSLDRALSAQDARVRRVQETAKKLLMEDYLKDLKARSPIKVNQELGSSSAREAASAIKETTRKFLPASVSLGAPVAAGTLGALAIHSAGKKAAQAAEDYAKSGTNPQELKAGLAKLPTTKKRETVQRIIKATSVKK